MKLRIASLSLLTLCMMLAAVPAMAQTFYSNGPTNGNRCVDRQLRVCC